MTDPYEATGPLVREFVELMAGYRVYFSNPAARNALYEFAMQCFERGQVDANPAATTIPAPDPRHAGRYKIINNKRTDDDDAE